LKNLLLGIDIGTSACKIVIFDKEGHILASSTKGYKVYYPKAGWAEQNPNEWYSAICEGIKETLLIGDINSDDIAGIGIGGQSWSAIAVDRNGKLLCNTPIWMDTRASEICKKVNEKIGAERIFDISGNSFEPMYTTPKILWYKENLPNVFKNTYKILQSNSYIAFRLTGIFSGEKSQGYGLHCFNMKKGIYNEKLCEDFEIPFEFLPKIYECSEVVGQVTKKAAGETGLSVGTPVVAGGLDAACGTLGAGVINDGQTQEQGGQAGGMSICLDEYKAHSKLILGFHVIPNKWLLQGGTVGGGGVIKWFNEQFCENKTLKELDEKAGKVNIGSDGLIFLPYMAGERSPIWNKNAKGVFFGLDYSKTKGHLFRACLEGVAFSLHHNLETAKEAGVNINVLNAIGGAANSRLWTQIKSDITGKVIMVPSTDTATTMGAAILAGVGTGVYKSFREAVKLTVNFKREHTPNMDNHKEYMKIFSIYLKLYENLKELM